MRINFKNQGSESPPTEEEKDRGSESPPTEEEEKREGWKS